MIDTPMGVNWTGLLLAAFAQVAPVAGNIQDASIHAALIACDLDAESAIMELLSIQ